MEIAIVTAGGAGMFCGACMHDNTWARGLIAAGHDVSLIPTYTPIRVDEQDVSTHRVFFGGINVYLESLSPLWRRIPRPLTRWLDTPRLLNLVTRFAISNDAHKLGRLTVGMLQGEEGPLNNEVVELTDYLANELKPDVICFSNALLSGSIERLKSRFTGPVFCLLQGDDIFLDQLPEPHLSRALELISRNGAHFDGFLVHSDYYRDFMSQYLGLPREKFQRIPLGIDLTGHNGQPGPRTGENFTIGYFARICKEKGLHHLVEAVRILRRRHPQVQLRVGGYLGKNDEAYFHTVQKDAADLGSAFQYIGSPATHAEKVDFYKSLDVLSVPTEYHEPKGIYVLEALANGVPVVQPRHGAFTELIEATGGGLLVEPGDPEDLAAGLHDLLTDDTRRQQLARTGHGRVHELFDTTVLVEASIRIFETALGMER